MTAFVDLPAPDFPRGSSFWARVTESTFSPFRGDDLEFATLVPDVGDAFLRVQRVRDGGPRVHVDLHATSVPSAVDEAVALGARVIDDRGHVIMASPAGLVFCIVAHQGEAVRPGPVGAESPHLVDQISIDVPHDAFVREVAFWADLTGWPELAGSRAEFVALERPATMPLRFLIQRLDADDGATSARAHLDLACGEHRDAVARQHVAMGATVADRTAIWTVMRDPVGMPYCLTLASRDEASAAPVPAAMISRA
ncbi:MAG: VOC family protein [Acidimicrobiales bacterium]